MKPRLNRTIYVAYNGSFSREQVIALGEDIFFHTGCINDCYVEEYRKPLHYDDYCVTWFTSLSQIRKKHKIKQIIDGYWEVK